MAIRRDATSLTVAEKAAFVNAVLQLKANGIYDTYVLRHAHAHTIHRSPSFLPWHRMFILEFEHDLQNVSGNPNLFLPYWDWTKDAALADPTSSPLWANDFMGGNGDPNNNNIVATGPFSQGWLTVDGSGNPAGPLTRSFGELEPDLPERKDIVRAMKRDRYDRNPWDDSSRRSFRNRLEGWRPAAQTNTHNLVHVWVGGSMLPMTSPNDPVFFLHHCFVDRIWCDWQKRYPNQNYRPTGSGPVGQNLNDQMEPTVYGTYRPADTLDKKALGYSYDQNDRWERAGCQWIYETGLECAEWATTARKQCIATASQQYLQCTQTADQGYNECAQTADQGYNSCTQTADQGYNSCAQTANQGYYECCNWWPCSWACDAWVWVDNIVCIAWTWINNVVCIAWTWIDNVVCVDWTWISYVVCVAWTWIVRTVCVAWTWIVQVVCIVFVWVIRRILFCG